MDTTIYLLDFNDHFDYKIRKNSKAKNKRKVS